MSESEKHTIMFHGDWPGENRKILTDYTEPSPPQQLSSKRRNFLSMTGKLGDYLSDSEVKIDSGSASIKYDACDIILTSGSFGGSGGFFSYNHYINTYTQLVNSSGSWIGTFPQSTMTYIPNHIGVRHDVARWDDKIYAIGRGDWTHDFRIQEWRIDPNPLVITDVNGTHSYNTVTKLRTIKVLRPPGFSQIDWENVPPMSTWGNYTDIGNGMDMKDANTIIAGTIKASTDGTAENAAHRLLEIDISGGCISCQSTATLSVSFEAANISAQTLFTDNSNLKAVDILYMQDTGNTLVSMADYGTSTGNWPSQINKPQKKTLRLFSPSNQLLDECLQPAGLGLYRANIQTECAVFITGKSVQGSVPIHRVDFNPLAISPVAPAPFGQWTGLNPVKGAAHNSNPNSGCCDASWDCDGQGNCYDPGGGNGQYSSLNDCENNCFPPTWRCTNTNQGCLPNPLNTDPAIYGPNVYYSLQDCENDCYVKRWTCTGRQGALLNCVMSSHPANAVPSGPGIFSSPGACNANCNQTTWNCTSGGCIDPGDQSGQYFYLNDCVDDCMVYECMDVLWPNTGSTCVPHAGGAAALLANPSWYATLNDCQTDCTEPPPNEFWNCDNGVCFSVLGSGQYTTLAACQAVCKDPRESWDCGTDYICYDPGTGLGQYQTLLACQIACKPGD